MDRLERLAVHLREAVRLAHSAEASELRISLMLFDGAVELMMHRAIEGELMFNSFNRRTLERAREFAKESPEAREYFAEYFAESIASLSSSVISKTRERKLDREFGQKLDFLAERGDIPVEQARVIRKLHDYRNETYHRDHVRTETIRPAVRLYGFIALELLETIRGGLMYLLLSPAPKSLTDLAPGLAPFSGEHRAQVAAALRERLGFHEGDIPSAELSDHVVARIDSIFATLDSIVRDLRDLYGESSGQAAFDRLTILHVVQLTEEEVSALTSAAETQATDVPVTFQRLAEWRSRAEALAESSDVLEAFARFAELEDEMEPFETQLGNFASELDSQVQFQYDLARGK